MPVHTHPHLRLYVLLCRAVGNERRLSILLFLLIHPYTGSELAQKLGISKAALSKHVHVLLRAGLVRSQRHAGSVLFTLAPNIGEMLQELVNLFPKRLTKGG